MVAVPKPRLNYYVTWTKAGASNPIVYMSGPRKGAIRVFYSRRRAVTALWQYSFPEDAAIHIHPTTEKVT